MTGCSRHNKWVAPLAGASCWLLRLCFCDMLSFFLLVSVGLLKSQCGSALFLFFGCLLQIRSEFLSTWNCYCVDVDILEVPLHNFCYTFALTPKRGKVWKYQVMQFVFFLTAAVMRSCLVRIILVSEEICSFDVVACLMCGSGWGLLQRQLHHRETCVLKLTGRVTASSLLIGIRWTSPFKLQILPWSLRTHTHILTHSRAINLLKITKGNKSRNDHNVTFIQLSMFASLYCIYCMLNFICEYTPFLEHKVPQLIHLNTLIARGGVPQQKKWVSRRNEPPHYSSTRHQKTDVWT